MPRSALRIVLFIGFVDLVGFGLIIPLQANYAERLGASGLTFGLLVGTYAAMQFIFNPILGRWSDRVGRRRVLLLSVAGSVVSHTLLGVADIAGSLPLLFLARTLDGITGANIATAQAYIADVTTSENRARGMGLFGAAFGLGLVVGPAIGAGLAELGLHVSGPAYGTAWPAFGAAVFSAIAVVLVWRLLPDPKREFPGPEREVAAHTLGRLQAALKQARVRELFILMFCATFAFVQLEATFVYLCTHELGVGVRGTGLLFAYVGMIMVIVQGGLVGRLVRKFGEMRLLTIAPFLTALGFLVISVVPSASGQWMAWTLLLAGCMPMALGHGLTGPSLSSLISRQADADRQGMTLGLAQGVASLARAVSPPVGGLLYDIGPSWPYWIGAAILALVGLFAVRVRAVQQGAVDNYNAPPPSA